jgi:hypothetical protein
MLLVLRCLTEPCVLTCDPFSTCCSTVLSAQAADLVGLQVCHPALFWLVCIPVTCTVLSGCWEHSDWGIFTGTYLFRVGMFPALDPALSRCSVWGGIAFSWGTSTSTSRMFSDWGDWGANTGTGMLGR